MSTIKQIVEGNNFTAINFGRLNEVENGKIFLKEATKTTGIEVSISFLPPRINLPIFSF